MEREKGAGSRERGQTDWGKPIIAKRLGEEGREKGREI